MDELELQLFEKRNIALVGDKYICRHFYLQFHSILNIKYFFVSSVNTDCFFDDYFFKSNPNIQCCSFKASLVKKEKLLIILCIDHFYRKPYDKLFFSRGLEWGNDYIDYIYVIQYYRYKYQTVLKEKNIWIFGAGNNGKYFYEKYKNLYSICGFISNFNEEHECEGLPVIRTDDILKQKNYYIMICSDADVIMAGQLDCLGLSGDKNYSFIENIPKKLFVAVGTCQIINTMEVLCQNINFSQKYWANVYFDNIYEPCTDADNRRLKSYGKFTDVVFYNVANAETVEFRNYEFIISEFYKNAIRLFMPFYYFRGQVMQATPSINPYALRSYDGEHFWFRGDQEINHMIEDGYSEEEILKNVLSDDYWTEDEIYDNFKRELKKVEILDRFSSFPIKLFIEENYQKLSIFNDGTHFSCFLCLYIANEIAKFLNFEPIEKIEKINAVNLRLSAMPIYPSVKRALGMKINSNYLFCNMRGKTVEYLEEDEFIKRYLHYVVSVQKLYRKLGTFWK